jgi:hypothetical protein
MRRLITVAALLLFGFAANAQTGTPGSGAPSANPTPPVREAPIGHRQPRPTQVPSEKNLSDPNDPANREDATLDRKIKSICRGC